MEIPPLLMIEKSDFNKLTHFFIWLSGASASELQECSKAEQRKYVAFGATVLVPCVFALITAAYAVSTLTENVTVISVVAVVWSFIILTVDRALLATYRAHQPFTRKITQLALRIAVAVLMGLTISHPLTLLLFKDTISSIIEKGRDADINAARTKFEGDKKQAEARIATVDAEIGTARKRWDDSFDPKFLAEPQVAPAKADGAVGDAGAKAELENKITVAQAPILERLAAVEKEIGEIELKRKALQAEIDHWQAEFEQEINGKRSGMTGVGPRAASIRDDQLVPRRAESQRLAATLDARTKDGNELRAESAAVAKSITTAEAAKANELVSKQMSEKAKMSSLRQQIAEQQAGQFVDQQTQVRASLRQQLDALLAQEKLVRSELTELVEEGAARVKALRAEPRRDLLKQTLALHQLFSEGAEGGTFALTAYLVLTLLFMLVDTIPVIVKFFSKPGPYDDLLDQLEVKSDRERRLFLNPQHLALDQDEKIRSARHAFLERHGKEVAEFSEKVRLERVEIEKARETGHKEDAAHREAALNERVSLFYEFSVDAKQKFFQHAHGYPSEAAEQARLAGSGSKTSGTMLPPKRAAAEANGVSRPLNGNGTSGHGADPAREKAAQGKGNDLAIPPRSALSVGEHSEVSGQKVAVPSRFELDETEDVLSHRVDSRWHANGFDEDVKALQDGRSAGMEHMPKKESEEVPLSSEAADLLGKLQRAHMEFSERIQNDRASLALRGDSEESRKRARALDVEEEEFSADLQATWDEYCKIDKTALAYAR